jgi:hypothetical protein
MVPVASAEVEMCSSTSLRPTDEQGIVLHCNKSGLLVVKTSGCISSRNWPAASP